MSHDILICASADSQLKYGAAIAEAFVARGWTRHVAIDRTQNHVNPRQLAELGLDGPLGTIDPLQALDGGFFDPFDAVYLQSIGSAMRRFLDAFAQRVRIMRPERRPILITGYVGLVIEKHLEGLLWRQGADLIAVNGAADHAIFSDFARELGLDASALVRTGFPYAREVRRGGAASPPRAGRTVLFAAQPTVPERVGQRVHLLQELARHARSHPGDRVLIKPRTLPGEHQFHVEKHHYHALLDRHLGSTRPANLEVVYGPLDVLLREADLLVTVSSTAAMEALAAGVPTRIISDVGIGESLGNHVFVGSGLIGPLGDLDQAFEARPEPAWLSRNGFAAEDRICNLVDAVEGRLAAQAAAATALPVPPVYLDRRRAPQVALEGVLSEPDAPCRAAPAKPAGRSGAGAAVMRKARKLIRDPRRFFADMHRGARVAS